MLNDRSSALSLLQTRRSGRARDLVEPGPSDSQLREIIQIAARTPDHGKLAPWRFVHVPADRRDAFAGMLEHAYRIGNPEPNRGELEAVDRLARQAPTLVIVLSRPCRGHKIPVWEQELSCGAVCMNLLHAAHAFGYAGSWITGWAAYSDAVHKAVAEEGERIGGFLFIGTPRLPLEERPRPELGEIFSMWKPAA
jgi:nitroreductase